MRENLRSYVENLFAAAPQTGKVLELKEELISNLTAKYDDLIAQGRSEEEAYKIAVGGIGDVDELIKGLENDKIYNYARQESDRQRSAIIVSTAVGLYIIAVAVQILFGVVDGLSPEIGCVLMFVIAAIATSMLVYNAMSRPRYRKTDDTLVEELKERKNASSESRQIYRAVSSAMWPLIVAVYLLISFFTGAWAYSWIIFIIGAALQNILKLAFQMRDTDSGGYQIYRSISSIMWPLIVAAYFVISFLSGAWAYSWIIFIIGAAVQNILKLAFEMRKKQ
jgi:hypothetical protein